MLQCFCAPKPYPTSITKFIADQPYLSLLENKCSSMKDLKKLHAQLIKTGLVKDMIAASRVLAFSSSPAGDINYAYLVFSQIKNPNVFAWNTIIRGFSHSSNPHIAIQLFIDMLVISCIQPDRLTYPSLFKAYARLGPACGFDGTQLHGRVIKLGLQSDQFIRNTIINMYANCGLLSEAWRMFNEELDIVAWNSMVIGLAKCGEIEECRKLFDKMECRNTVSWNSMISGYVRNGKFLEALELFHEMQQHKIRPTEFTMVSLLNACACLGAITQGKWIHDYIINQNFELNSVVVTAIIDMYCKCGNVEEARQVFTTSPKQGLSCWNAMIIGLATNGCENEAIQLFSELDQSWSLKPDRVSFIAVLMACNHAGMVGKAKYYFSLMTQKYKIKPTVKHYSCLVDVLGNGGLLEKAEHLITSMPIKKDAIIWGSLLSACRKHGNVEMAKKAAKHLIQLDPAETSGYVLLSNVYAATEQFKEAIKLRLSMKEKQLEKELGCSQIEVNGEVHEFVSGGRLHPQSKEIYSALNEWDWELLSQY